MYSQIVVPLLPLWALALILFTILPACAYLGFRVGKIEYSRNRYAEKPASSLPGDRTLSAMLAILGLLLAFTFATALNRAQERKIALTEEAAAIGTAFLRADMAAEPRRTELRAALVDYARTRVLRPGTLKTQEDLNRFIAKSMEVQSKLWPATLQLLESVSNPAERTFIADGVIRVLDAHTRRITAASQSIPAITKFMLMFSAAVAMTLLGNRAALEDRPLTWRVFAFSGLLTIVMIIILDLDRSVEGFILINTEPLEATIIEMEKALAAGGSAAQ